MRPYEPNKSWALCVPLDVFLSAEYFNKLRTGDADTRFYITTVQDG